MRQLQPLLSLVLLSTLAAACDEDSESGDIPEPVRFSELKLPFTDAPGCNAAAAKRNDNWPATTCRCERCLERMQECAVVPGCNEIIECANQSRCGGELGCYLIPGAPCATVIDTWGNSSLATTIATEIFKCSTDNGCR
jgi:hypothetical protein